MNKRTHFRSICNCLVLLLEMCNKISVIVITLDLQTCFYSYDLKGH